MYFNYFKTPIIIYFKDEAFQAFNCDSDKRQIQQSMKVQMNGCMLLTRNKQLQMKTGV